MTDGPLVIELFTSQGCSSCPPAEQLLARLTAAGSLGDRALAPLAFHVDYWNDLGWVDPYSSATWSERQHQYARAIGDGRVYTPQLVVGGAAGVIGSDLAAVTGAVRRAARPAALAATADWAGAEPTVAIAATAPADAEVWAAVWEDGAPTQVARGENAGETMGGDRVVRRLARIAGPGQKASVAIKLDPAWHIGGAVVFAQRPDRHIVASAALVAPAALRRAGVH
jgi:hypothetical protein